MKFTPHEYQLGAAKFLLGQPHAGLLLDMGLGKTSISLFCIKQLLAAGHVKRILLIAPIRPLYTVWPNEIKKWDDFNDVSYHNWHESRLEPHKLPQADLYGINPESFLTLAKHKRFGEAGFDMLIIDESQTFKNYSSQRFKFLKPLLHLFKYRWILTGTPAPNGLEDLWSQIYILDRGEALGQYITHFRNNYCVPSRDGFSYEVIPQYREQLYRQIAHLVYRLSARDHLDMPDLIFNPIPVRLNDKAFKMYKEMEKELIILLESGEHIMSPNSAVAGMRCRQIANGSIYKEDRSIEFIHMDKANALKEVVDNLQGQPLLVFYEFVHDLVAIQKVLGDVPNLTASKNPNKLIDEFNAGKHPVMVGYPSTIGVGLNLQGACSNILWMGPPWDLGVHDQANARVWRQGQEADRVVVHYLMAERTLDAKVLSAIQAKGAIQADLLKAVESIRNETASV